MVSETSIVVSFRLGAEEYQALQTLADRQSMSPSARAKAFVLSGLGGTTIGETSEVTKLRHDLAVLLESLLVSTKALSAEEAKRFVREKL